jgi:hypothetical protein
MHAGLQWCRLHKGWWKGKKGKVVGGASANCDLKSGSGNGKKKKVGVEGDDWPLKAGLTSPGRQFCCCLLGSMASASPVWGFWWAVEALW